MQPGVKGVQIPVPSLTAKVGQMIQLFFASTDSCANENVKVLYKDYYIKKLIPYSMHNTVNV